jgi:hypothetical protein
VVVGGPDAEIGRNEGSHEISGSVVDFGCKHAPSELAAQHFESRVAGRRKSYVAVGLETSVVVACLGIRKVEDVDDVEFEA